MTKAERDNFRAVLRLETPTDDRYAEVRRGQLLSLLDAADERDGLKAGAVIVWSFYDAPQHLRDLSTNGGDDDWIALVPAGYEHYLGWAEDGGRFGCCCVDEHTLPDGRRVLIGSHS